MMDQQEFDHIGQVIVNDLRQAAGCNTRNCRTELYLMTDIPDRTFAHLHHGARWFPEQPRPRWGEIAVIASYNAEFGQQIIRRWRGEHGMVDLAP